MLENDMFDDLRNMHSVLSDIDEQQPMADAMRDHIIHCGNKIMQRRVKEIIKAMEKKKLDEYKISPTFIEDLLNLYRKYKNVIDNQFKCDPLFEQALVQSFQHIMKNEPEDHLSASAVTSEYFVSPNAKCLAEKVDYIYCHSNEFDTRDDLEKRLNECAVLFDFLMDKDIFIDFHTHFLAQRLLGKHVSTSEEKILISKIKMTQGPQFTSRQETMIADLEKYQDQNNVSGRGRGSGSSSSSSSSSSRSPPPPPPTTTTTTPPPPTTTTTTTTPPPPTTTPTTNFSTNFQQQFLEVKKLGSERWRESDAGTSNFHVKLLTDKSWPTIINPPDLIIPECIRLAIQHHQHYYQSFELHASRSLKWSHMLGSMELSFVPKRKGRAKRYTIQMTPLQAYVALSFHSFDQKMTGMQLNSLLNIDGEQGVTPTIEHAKKLKRILHAFCYSPKKKIMLCLDRVSFKKLKKLKMEHVLQYPKVRTSIF